MRPRTVAAVALVAVLTACGSTVPRLATGEAGNGLSATPGGTTASAGSSAAAPAGGGSASSIAPTGAAVAGAPSTTSLGVSPTTGTEAPEGPASGPPLKIGVLYTAGLQQLATAFGSSAKTPDPKVYVQDLVSYVNHHGGLDGHPISPVFAEINTESTTDLDIQYQAACSTFTEDNHVFAVASPSSISDDFATCVGQRHIPLISAWGIAISSDASSAAMPLVFEPNTPTYDTAARALVGDLVAQDWASTRWSSGGCPTSKTPEIGLLIDDTPEDRAVYGSIIGPEFLAAGTPVKDVIWMTLGGDVADAITQAATEAASAILKFESDCVDHVLIQTPNPVVPELFMTAALEQHYTPRYGWDSDQAPIDSQEISSNLATELRGSLGVGWQPYNDVPLSQFDAIARAPGEHCLSIFTQAGLPPTGRADGYSDLQICDSLLFLQAALAGAPEPLGAQTLASQVAELGSTYAPSLSYRSLFTPTRHVGASAYRTFAFSDACSCFRYTSGLLSF